MANNKIYGRGERIRTSDSCVPNAVLYQAELHPEAITRLTGWPCFTETGPPSRDIQDRSVVPRNCKARQL